LTWTMSFEAVECLHQPDDV